MSGLKLSRLILHGAFAAGLLTIFSMAIPSLALGVEEDIKIHFAGPWRAGVDTVKVMEHISPKWGKYTFLVIGRAPMNSIVKYAKDNEIDMAILAQNQWFEALNEGHSFVAVAEMGPYVAVVNEDVFRKKNTTIAEFLQTWQSAWLKTDYPYGVQPPEISFLKKKYSDFSREQGLVRFRDISPLTKILIKHRPVKSLPEKALVMSRDYYASIGVNVRSLSNAKPGETYEGRIMDEFSEYIELDKNPCELDLINIEKPHDKKKTGKSKNCEGKEWDIYHVAKR